MVSATAHYSKHAKICSDHFEKEGISLTLVRESVQNTASLKSTSLRTRQSILANPQTASVRRRLASEVRHGNEAR